MNFRKILICFVISIMLLCSCSENIDIKSNIERQDEIIQVSKYERNVDLSVIKEDLNDLNDSLSQIVQDKIINEIDLTSNKYNIPPILLHAIFRIESDYRFWIDHPVVNVKVYNKRIKTNAIGLGGIMWVFWKDSLIANEIAKQESDLYIPETNVKATGFILRNIINSEVDKSNKNNIIKNIIRRYYGATSKEYETKMKLVTSDLLMKRVAKHILDN